MGSYRLLQLRLKNYRSFREAVVEFPPSGLTLIRGSNLDTGGSSGAGKSSVPVAIALALGFCPFSSKDQRSWGATAPMSVQLDFEADGGVWTVARGDKTWLKPPEGETITSAAAVEAKLGQLFGVSPEVLGALTYRQQQSRGLFLRRTDSEKKEFLGEVLDLVRFETAIDASKVEQKQLEATAGMATLKVQQLEAQLRSLPAGEATLVDTWPLETALLAVEGRPGDIATEIVGVETQIGGLEVELAGAQGSQKCLFELKLRAAKELLCTNQARLAGFEPVVDLIKLNKLNADHAEAGRRLSKAASDDDNRRQTVQGGRQSLEARLAALRHLNRNIAALEAAQALKKGQIESLRASRCPTCEQTWVAEGQKLLDWELEAEKLGNEIQNSRAAQQQIPVLEAELQALVWAPDPRLQRLQELVAQLKADARAESEQLGSLEKEQRRSLSEEVQRAQAALTQIQLEESQAVAFAGVDIQAKLGILRQQLQRLQADKLAAVEAESKARLALKVSLVENQARQAEAERRLRQRTELSLGLETAQGEVVAATTRLCAEQDFEFMIGYKGFLGVIFDEVLAEIQEEANTILASVANTAHVVLNFTSEAVTLKGVVRKEIRPVVTVGGFTAHIGSGLSGGMMTSVDLAVDLAVATVVSRRTNSWPAWMIFDEAFEGLDPVSKETAMEMLTRYSSSRLVLVVDHASELKELFAQSIFIDYKNGVSSIRG